MSSEPARMFVLKDANSDIYLLPFDPSTGVIDWTEKLEEAAVFQDEELAQMMLNYLADSLSEATEIWEIKHGS